MSPVIDTRLQFHIRSEQNREGDIHKPRSLGYSRAHPSRNANSSIARSAHENAQRRLDLEVVNKVYVCEDSRKTIESCLDLVDAKVLRSLHACQVQPILLGSHVLAFKVSSTSSALPSHYTPLQHIDEMTDTPQSGAATPNQGRFTSQAADVEDRLKADTVGLVTLDDFRKRRAEALEVAQSASSPGSGAATPDGRESVSKPAFKKRKKAPQRGGLSFGDDEEDSSDISNTIAKSSTSRSETPTRDGSVPPTDSEAPPGTLTAVFKKKSLRPNSAVSLQPKVMTKMALLKEAQLKEQWKKEYAQIQEAVKATEFVIPFVFYDGKDVPGGLCRMKKGDHIWLFLERARKVGADLAGRGDRSRRDWARISVDDLMVVKGDIIIPHHYDFHHFILNRSIGYHGPLFTYSSEPTPATPQNLLPESLRSASATPEPQQAGLQTAAQRRQQAAAQSGPADGELEGFNDDPSSTKVVDRRWYERNKHIYPASGWEEFDATRDYSSGVRKDPNGNAMFFSR